MKIYGDILNGKILYFTYEECLFPAPESWRSPAALPQYFRTSANPNPLPEWRSHSWVDLCRRSTVDRQDRLRDCWSLPAGQPRVGYPADRWCSPRWKGWRPGRRPLGPIRWRPIHWSRSNRASGIGRAVGRGWRALEMPSRSRLGPRPTSGQFSEWWNLNINISLLTSIWWLRWMKLTFNIILSIPPEMQSQIQQSLALETTTNQVNEVCVFNICV